MKAPSIISPSMVLNIHNEDNDCFKYVIAAGAKDLEDPTLCTYETLRIIE